MAHPREGLAPFDLPGWKTAAGWAAALVLSALFLSSGIWKIIDPQGWSMRLAQAKVPESMALAGALGFGIAETLAGTLILVPRFRRWGSILTAFLLLAFLVYFALNYSALRGQDCSCFPWLKRVVGPNFFIGDGLMLVAAAVAGVWSKPSGSLRSALPVLGAVVVFAGVSYGVEAVRQTGTKAPESITVDGKPYSLERGKVFLFFFHPECMHCFDSAKRMSQYHWGDTRVVAIPVEVGQYAPQFLNETGLQAGVSPDFETLKKIFGYSAYPFGVAIENGRQKAAVTKFADDEPAATLKKLAFVY
jgi:uncharacterized membrane protein YphA (DoxX/SURF4 family)